MTSVLLISNPSWHLPNKLPARTSFVARTHFWLLTSNPFWHLPNKLPARTRLVVPCTSILIANIEYRIHLGIYLISYRLEKARFVVRTVHRRRRWLVIITWEDIIADDGHPACIPYTQPNPAQKKVCTMCRFLCSLSLFLREASHKIRVTKLFHKGISI